MKKIWQTSYDAERLNTFLGLRSGTRQGGPLSCNRVLAPAIREWEGRHEGIHIGKEVKLSV